LLAQSGVDQIMRVLVGRVVQRTKEDLIFGRPFVRPISNLIGHFQLTVNISLKSIITVVNRKIEKQSNR